jgi:hypothetical protein
MKITDSNSSLRLKLKPTVKKITNGIKNQEIIQWMKPSLAMIQNVYQYDLSIHMDRYSNHISRWYSSLGKAATVDRCKFIYSCAQNWFLYQPMPVQPTIWIKTDKDGFPKCISYIKDSKLRDDPIYIGAVLCSLAWHKSVVLPGKPDLTSITDTRLTVNTNRLDDNIAEIIEKKKIKIKNLNRIFEPEHIISLKNGPNGPKLKTSVHDLQALQGSQILESIHEWILDSSDIVDDIYELEDDMKNPTGDEIHSRIGVKREFGGKIRCYAVLDYWTQICLKPLHEELNNILKKNFPSDCTFDQDSGCEAVRGFTAQFKDVYSFDLTAATDRLPADLQKKVVAKLIGNDKANLWFDILVNREFSLGKEKIKYGVGQPMGAYSSWPAMALTHHCIALYAGADQYRILGDDVVICGRKPAQRYLEIMRKLGVSISKHKSVLPRSNTPTSAEFAKRIFKDGIEITPLPTNLIMNRKGIISKKIMLLKYLERLSFNNTSLFDSLQQNDLLIERIFKTSQTQVAVDFISFPDPNRNISPLNLSRHKLTWVTNPNDNLPFDHERFSMVVLDTTYKYLMAKVKGLYKSLEENSLFATDISPGELKLSSTSSWPAHPLSYAIKSIKKGPWKYWDTIYDANLVTREQLANGYRLKVPLPLEVSQLGKRQTEVFQKEFELMLLIKERYLKSINYNDDTTPLS